MRSGPARLAKGDHIGHMWEGYKLRLTRGAEWYRDKCNWRLWRYGWLRSQNMGQAINILTKCKWLSSSTRPLPHILDLILWSCFMIFLGPPIKLLSLWIKVQCLISVFVLFFLLFFRRPLYIYSSGLKLCPT